MPSHGKRLATIEHPRPIHALIDFCGEVLDFLIGEILPRRENATQENRGIDGGKFALLPATAGFHVNEVEEESVFVVQIVGNETKLIPDALDDLGRLSVITSVADTKTGQPESGGGDTRHHPRIIAVGERAVFHLARLGTGFVPEEIETCALNLLEELLVSPFIRRAAGLHGRRRIALLTTGESHKR